MTPLPDPGEMTSEQREAVGRDIRASQPSPEAMKAAREIYRHITTPPSTTKIEPLEPLFATLIDSAFADRWKKVERLKRAAEQAMHEIVDPEDTDLPDALAALKEHHDPVA